MKRKPPTNPKYIHTSEKGESLGIQKEPIIPPIITRYLIPQPPFWRNILMLLINRGTDYKHTWTAARGSLVLLTPIMMRDMRAKKSVTMKQSL